MNGNREYRSDVFSMLMADKKNALQVYNALNGTHYDDPELVEIHTIDKGVSLSVRNDSAIVVDSSLSLYEHQSTVCPNMPIRCLFYVSNILRKLTKDANLYGTSLIRIPVPKFAVFYNGTTDMPSSWEVKLSDSFMKPESSPELELVCKVYNINPDKGEGLLDDCKILDDYMTYVDLVRAYYKEYELKDAINMAIDECIKRDILADFFKENREEILKVTELDFTFERQIELERKSALEQGIEQGILGSIKMLSEMNLPYDVVLEKVMQVYNIEPSKARKLMDEYYTN